MKWLPSGPALIGAVCALLAGCSVGPTYKRPDIALPTQWHESAGADAGASASVWPAAEWWHGFGSAKLDELIAEAERNNDDLAGAIARVQEADAQVRIAGAALLPSLDLGATGTRQRAPTASLGVGGRVFNVFNSEFSASYELDFWGKNRALRDAARGRDGQPLRSANRRAHGGQQRRHHVFSSARAARPHPSGATESRERPEDPQRLQARAVGRHRHGTRRRSARNHGGDTERRDSAAIAAIPPNRVCAGRAHRRDARIGRRRYGHAQRDVEPGRRRRSAVAAPVAPSGCGLGGTTADRRQRGYHRRPGCSISQHSADGERRLPEPGACVVRESAQPGVRGQRGSDSADLSRRRAPWPGGL